MNYQNSIQILKKVEGANRILVNCHVHPDPDSIGSALATYEILTKMGKNVDLVCPNNITVDLKFLFGFEKIKKIDFSNFNFSDYDLLLIIDTADWDRVFDEVSLAKPDMDIIVIDHHKTNPGFGTINIIDSEVNSTAEVLALIFEDWGVEINKSVATSLMTGIIGDTGAFRFPGTSMRTFEIAADLIRKGAEKDKIIYKIYFSIPEKLFKFWSEALSLLKVNKKLRFAHLAVPNSLYKKYEDVEDIKESIATNFIQSIKGTDMGLVMVEYEKGDIGISLRSRTGVDVSKIAEKLGGGGHKAASGASIKGVEFNPAVKKVIEIVKETMK